MEFIIILKIVLLGIIEGITEFLPVSSTGHLILAGQYLQLDTPEGTFEIALQLGAILAVVVLYWDFFKTRFTPKDFFNRTNQKMIVAIVPFLLIGFFCYSIIKSFFDESIVLWALIFGGVVMCIVDAYLYLKRGRSMGSASAFNHKDGDLLPEVSMKQAFVVGLCQCFAFIPGMSRSGSTIVGGVVSGLSYKTATKFSFLLSVPVMVCAVGYELLKSFHELTVSDMKLLGIGILVSFVSGYLSMVFLINMIERWKLFPFGIYRILLGITGLMLLG